MTESTQRWSREGGAYVSPDGLYRAHKNIVGGWHLRRNGTRTEVDHAETLSALKRRWELLTGRATPTRWERPVTTTAR